MEQITKIAVIGGTGKSGKYLVSELLNRGFHLRLLLRNPENFQTNSPLIEIIKGDARNYEPIHSLLEGCHAILSTLGQPKGEKSIFSDATKNIIKAMTEYDITRYILTTGLNVDTPFDKKSEIVKFGTEWMKTNYPETTLDKQVEYELLAQSNIDWTLVRLPVIELTDEKKEIRISLEDCPSDKISAASLADFIVRQLDDETYLRKVPFVANA